jgi:hypothetical protein
MRLPHELYLLLRGVRRDMEKDRDYYYLVRVSFKEEIREGRTIHFYHLLSALKGSKLGADELPLLIA